MQLELYRIILIKKGLKETTITNYLNTINKFLIYLHNRTPTIKLIQNFSNGNLTTFTIIRNYYQHQGLFNKPQITNTKIIPSYIQSFINSRNLNPNTEKQYTKILIAFTSQKLPKDSFLESYTKYKPKNFKLFITSIINSYCNFINT